MVYVLLVVLGVVSFAAGYFARKIWIIRRDRKLGVFRVVLSGPCRPGDLMAVDSNGRARRA